MMQARWGSHGDYAIIALSPNSPQESFDLTIRAFNLAEQYRVPVLLMLDECVGHMTERVEIPPADKIDIVPRRYYTGSRENFLLYRPESDGVPAMVKAGDGYRIHVTGLTHDERGYPAMTAAAQDTKVRRLLDKIRRNAPNIIDYREDQVEGAQVVVVTYGISSRTAIPAIEMARREGMKVGHLRLVVVWPFPEARIREIASAVDGIVVPELNLGQIKYEVERCAAGQAPVSLVGHAGGGVHEPRDIYQAIVKMARKR
jgi:2-oxoglutarate ferredoxin oxidoreductase subunit alpha